MEASAFERAQLFEGGGRFAAQFKQALGVFAQQFAGRSQCAFARDAFEERLADFVFEAADGMADSRLCAAKAHGRTGEPAFFDHGEEGFQLRKVHKFDCDFLMSPR